MIIWEKERKIQDTFNEKKKPVGSARHFKQG